ncbi:hypothetical protein LR48_Vigan07g195900 [Vigna angularis]|uniref:Uncharacterized protein n=1 Tax=Phaseolus angularis TaxID=3914 RepID=A0A0L9UZF9_PHAAN|nr:hypothetical protein LR48_Vigan07g195900 [Vigna angularis]
MVIIYLWILEEQFALTKDIGCRRGRTSFDLSIPTLFYSVDFLLIGIRMIDEKFEVVVHHGGNLIEEVSIKYIDREIAYCDCAEVRVHTKVEVEVQNDVELVTEGKLVIEAKLVTEGKLVIEAKLLHTEGGVKVDTRSGLENHYSHHYPIPSTIIATKSPISSSIPSTITTIKSPIPSTITTIKSSIPSLIPSTITATRSPIPSATIANSRIHSIVSSTNEKEQVRYQNESSLDVL